MAKRNEHDLLDEGLTALNRAEQERISKLKALKKTVRIFDGAIKTFANQLVQARKLLGLPQNSPIVIGGGESLSSLPTDVAAYLRPDPAKEPKATIQINSRSFVGNNFNNISLYNGEERMRVIIAKTEVALLSQKLEVRTSGEGHLLAPANEAAEALLHVQIHKPDALAELGSRLELSASLLSFARDRVSTVVRKAAEVKIRSSV